MGYPPVHPLFNAYKKCHFSSKQMKLFIRQLDDLGIYSRQRSKQMADKKLNVIRDKAFRKD